jgi:hypothetical protein
MTITIHRNSSHKEGFKSQDTRIWIFEILKLKLNYHMNMEELQELSHQKSYKNDIMYHVKGDEIHLKNLILEIHVDLSTRVGSSRQPWQAHLFTFIVLQQSEQASSKTYVVVPKSVLTKLNNKSKWLKLGVRCKRF